MEQPSTFASSFSSTGLEICLRLNFYTQLLKNYLAPALVNSSEFVFHFALLLSAIREYPRSSRGIEKGNVLFTRCYVVAKCLRA